MAKYWHELEDQGEALVDMAMDLGDLNIFSEETKRRMYNDMYGIENDPYDKQENNQSVD